MSNALSADEITTIVKSSFPDAQVELVDLTGTSDHWSATIVTEAFDGLSRIRRHRLVNAALAEPLKGPIHALALKTLTPAEAQAL